MAPCWNTHGDVERCRNCSETAVNKAAQATSKVNGGDLMGSGKRRRLQHCSGRFRTCRSCPMIAPVTIRNDYGAARARIRGRMVRPWVDQCRRFGGDAQPFNMSSEDGVYFTGPHYLALPVVFRQTWDVPGLARTCRAFGPPRAKK